ncbi:hypothetical protein SELMODRAFT_409611 [Selaginella moellendorffii]|uniref:Uncharacterized protein n=1 Tax=Selaginella moellendorffii TaxID=88036 RepID=D8RC02_SELML|nr:hypothetical protein SELMODRAFT_409611 [Selaginella moellendorffii]
MGYAKETPDLFAEDDEDVEDPTSLQHRHSNVFVKVYRGLCEELRVAVDLKNSTSGSSENVYQLAAVVMKNLALERREQWRPVCIQVWGTVRWYYGYVETHEFVQVENEELVEESLACFPLTKREALSLTVPGSVPPRRIMIRKKFAEWKANLYGQEMKIPDGRYPFIDPWGQRILDQQLTASSQLFYEGMLKTLVGREVTKWTPRDERGDG